jgi:hypothetical protein
MMIKHLGLATLTALCLASAAQAAPVTANYNINLVGSPSGHASAGLSNSGGGVVSHMVAGEFLDTFTFSYTGKAWIDALLETQFSKASQQITFFDANVNGIALTLDEEVVGRTTFRTAELLPSLSNGNFVLTVHGWAGALNAPIGSSTTASYSGTLNVTPSNVPEPSSVALLAASFGALAFTARRRKAGK